MTLFSKNSYDFSVFYKVFSKNRIKMFLKIIINFYDGFFLNLIKSYNFQKTV